MSKERHTTKESKKQPQHSLKEKRAIKHARKHAAEAPAPIVQH